MVPALLVLRPRATAAPLASATPARPLVLPLHHHCELTTSSLPLRYISIILLLFLYMCAIIARMLYGTNDNWHFGSLQKAMMTLFRCATLEDWTDVMYIQMFGCREYQGDGNCPQGKSSGLGWVAAVYFLIFTLIGALVLLTLFIGVVTTSMDGTC